MFIIYRTPFYLSVIFFILFSNCSLVQATDYFCADEDNGQPLEKLIPTFDSQSDKKLKLSYSTLLDFSSIAQIKEPVLLASNVLQRVIPSGDEEGSQGQIVKETGKALNLSAQDIDKIIERLGASSTTGCNEKIFNDLVYIQKSIVRNYRLDDLDGTQDLVLARFIEQKKLGVDIFVDPQKSKAFSDFENAYRAVVTNCFIPAESDPFFKNSGLASRVGIIGSNESNFCTGTLLNDDHALTALHCFYNRKDGRPVNRTAEKIWLITGSDRREICQSQLRKSFNKTILSYEDRIILKVAPANKTLPKLQKLSSLSDIETNPISETSPTRLKLFGYMFIASKLMPDQFKSGLVSFNSPGCYVLVKDSTCFIHLCGSTPGSSGAAMFTGNENAPQIVGVHIGSQSQNDICRTKLGLIEANYANTATFPEITPYTIP